MATTVSTAAISDEGEYVVANIGDSRTYLFRDGRLSRLTRDDTLVQRLVDAGEISDVEGRRHPQRSVVLNALDGAPGREPRVSTVAAREEERLLVCSDGLTDVVDDRAIARTLSVWDGRVLGPARCDGDRRGRLGQRLGRRRRRRSRFRA